MGLIGALGPLIEAGRIKVYSCDSVAGRGLSRRNADSSSYCSLAARTNSTDYVGP